MGELRVEIYEPTEGKNPFEKSLRKLRIPDEALARLYNAVQRLGEMSWEEALKIRLISGYKGLGGGEIFKLNVRAKTQYRISVFRHTDPKTSEDTAFLCEVAVRGTLEGEKLKTFVERAENCRTEWLQRFGDEET